MLGWAVQGVIRLPMSPMVLYQTPRFYVFIKLDLGITYHYSFGLSAMSSLGRTNLFIYSGKVTQQRDDVSSCGFLIREGMAGGLAHWNTMASASLAESLVQAWHLAPPTACNIHCRYK